MKKLFALLLVLCMIFSLTACAQSEAEKELADAQSELKDAADSGDLDDMADALDDYTDKAEDAGATTSMNAKKVVDLLVNSDEWKAQTETLKGQGLSCELEARDNYLAYVYQYSFDINDLDIVKTNLDATKDNLKSLADSLAKVYTGIDGVIFEYRAKDGSVIGTYTF